MTTVFDLTKNPFHLLELSIRARKETVVEMHEEAIADGRADEVVLARAQQAVLTPRTRLEAELSWLPGIPPSQAREILSEIERNNLAGICGALERLEGLDKTNLAAHLCARSNGEIKYVKVLLDAYDDFAVGVVHEIIKGLRSVSGFPIPDQERVKSTLAALKIVHSKAAVACLVAAESPGEALTEIVEAYLDEGDDNVVYFLNLNRSRVRRMVTTPPS